jgi:hypothetical protein
MSFLLLDDSGRWLAGVEPVVVAGPVLRTILTIEDL